MKKRNDKISSEEFVISYLKKNKNFFIKYPELIQDLNFPNKDNSSEKVIDLDTYRYKKISQQNIDLQNQMTKILIAGKNHQNAQKRILKSTLRILNIKSLSKLIDLISNDLKNILACDIVNCFTTNNNSKIENLNKIDLRITQSYFKNNSLTNLNQNPKGILLYFPNESKLIKSYILLKITYDNNYLVVAMGSKNKENFTPDMQVDLVEFLIKIIEIKLKIIK